MISPDLPSELKAALGAKSEGLSRVDAAKRAGAMSQVYRGGGTSAPIRTEQDALAYALVRMPATYAAISASLHALREQRPDFAPATLLDVGAGPATASWAAAQAFETLVDFAAIDSNPALRALACDTVAGSRLAAMRYVEGDVLAGLAAMESADLVLASYVINELGDADRATLTDLMWQKARDTLLVVEPGTPSGYERILALRARLIAQGAHVIAPCPHDNACPLTAPDWCHFSQRLARSRAHKQLKGADVPFEDERFIYVALSRSQLKGNAARVLAQPALNKVAVSAKLCTQTGLSWVSVPRRDKAAYAAARRWDWGDAVPDPAAE
ncbi:Ketopantoate hydroxymethyltransferase OS=Afipia felis OX=1035 GN=NCTC12722_03010 PE=4 SV=1 [Afipia felis]